MIGWLQQSWSRQGNKARGTLVLQVDRISDTLWEIPMTHKEGMRVPAAVLPLDAHAELTDFLSGVLLEAR